MRQRPGWERSSAGFQGKGGRWRHIASDWTIHHCGHPTANRPYYGLAPDGGKMFLTGGFGIGVAFSRLLDCQLAVEAHINRAARPKEGSE